MPIIRGGFRGVSVVSIQTPFVPDNLVIESKESKTHYSSRSQYEPGEVLGFQCISFLGEVLRDLLWLTLA